MFNPGDKVYVIDSSRWHMKNEIDILERDFIKYTDTSKRHLKFDGESSLTIESWAVSPTIDDATKFAVSYLILVYELKKDIKNINFIEEYKFLEKTYPDLIFKYMDKVVDTV